MILHAPRKRPKLTVAEATLFWQRLLSLKETHSLNWQWFSWQLGETAATLSTWASCKRRPTREVADRLDKVIRAIEEGTEPDSLLPIAHAIRIAVPIEKVGLCACGCGRLIVRGYGSWNKRYWDEGCRDEHRRRILR